MSVRKSIYATTSATALVLALSGAASASTTINSTCAVPAGEPNWVVCNIGAVVIEPTEVEDVTIVTPKFDDDGGNRILTEVRYQFNGGFLTDVEATNNGASPITAEFETRLTYLFSNVDPLLSLTDFMVEDIEPRTIDPGETKMFTYTETETIQEFPVNFGDWIGAGDTFEFTINTDTRLGSFGTGGNLTIEQTSKAGYFFGVRYIWEERPPVGEIPLPAAGWMLLTGLLGLGGLGWARRRAS